MGLEKLVRSSVQELSPYKAIEQRGLRLDLNTNLFGPNPSLLKFLKSASFRLNDYPTQNSDALREALAEEFELSPDNVIVGNGSDEIFDLVGKAFINPGDVVTIPAPTFVMYKIYAKIHLGKVIEIPLLKNWQLDVNKFTAQKSKLTILASPNNPTGNCFETKDMLKIIENSGGLVVLDEAYAEYAGKSLVPQLKDHPNLIITRTFSKAYGLAGLRVGYGLASAKIINELNKVKPPYNLNLVSERVAIQALSDKKFLKEVVNITRKERERLRNELTQLGFVVYNSATNFVLAGSPIRSRELFEKLKNKGILVKDFGAQPMLRDCVRITVGRPEQNSVLLKRIREILGR